jgi:cytochrome c oxidase subunit III
MASFIPNVAIGEPTTTLGGGSGAAPPPIGYGGDDGGYFSPAFDTRLRRARLGISVAIAGIVMIFVSFTSAYIVRQGLPTLDSRTGTLVRDWIEVPLPLLFLINTIVLLVSTATMELARRQAAREAAIGPVASLAGIASGLSGKISWLTITIVLGLYFLAGQWMAWQQLGARGFYLATSPSCSFVYLLTGMHGLHLLGGICALLFACAASLLRRSASSRLIVLDVTGWYWHFMALLWVYILCLLEFAR